MRKYLILNIVMVFTVISITAQTKTTDTGVVINGVKWATRNVDIPGTFAANPEDAGMFYQWNRKIGWTCGEPMINSNGGTMWDNSDTEFLPAAGSCYYKDGARGDFDDLYGSYWNSIFSGAIAYVLYFNNANVFFDIGTIYPTGFSVRCVAE